MDRKCLTLHLIALLSHYQGREKSKQLNYDMLTTLCINTPMLTQSIQRQLMLICTRQRESYVDQFIQAQKFWHMRFGPGVPKDIFYDMKNYF